jgi:L-alanine-DL-glutamate epimerase-like enolase superfamily enzyme
VELSALGSIGPVTRERSPSRVGRILIELQGGDERSGLAETDDAPGVYEALEVICRTVVGRDIRQYRMLQDTIWPNLSLRLGSGLRSAFGAVENAAWDLAARQFDVPLAALLSGRRQATVPILKTIFPPRSGASNEFSAETELSDAALALIDHAIDQSRRAGARLIVCASAQNDWLRDIAFLQAIRAARGSGIGLALDGRGHHSGQALSASGRAIADLNLDYVIDPAPDLYALASVRAQIPCPVAARRLLHSPADVAQAIRLDIVDIVLGDAASWGGIAPLLDCSALCHVFELDLGLVAGHGAGISLATNVAVASSEQTINRGISLAGTGPHSTPLIDADLGICEGRSRISARPGIGVSLAARRVKECLLAETVVE